MVLVTITHHLPQALSFNLLMGSQCNMLSIFFPMPAMAGGCKAGCIRHKCILVGSAAALVLSEALCLIIYAFLYYHGI